VVLRLAGNRPVPRPLAHEGPPPTANPGRRALPTSGAGSFRPTGGATLGQSMAYWSRVTARRTTCRSTSGRPGAGGAGRRSAGMPLDCALRRYVRRPGLHRLPPSDLVAGPSGPHRKSIRRRSLAPSGALTGRPTGGLFRGTRGADPRVVLDVGRMFRRSNRGSSVVGLLFLVLSGVFSFGWVWAPLSAIRTVATTRGLARLQPCWWTRSRADLRRNTVRAGDRHAGQPARDRLVLRRGGR